MDDNTGMSLFKPGVLNIENPLQNQEEAEELEDQKRRQEEIQNLLTVAMDEFNYDDSTMNSSGNASGVEEANLMEKYKNASMDEQLKVLYEVRVREIKALTEQIGGLKTELSKQKDEYLKKLMIMEAEKNQAQISLEQSQKLLVAKSDEIDKLHSELENINGSIANLRGDMMKLSEENISLKHTNEDLFGQLSLMQKGLATNTVLDRDAQERHQNELQHLRMSLETTLARLDRKENECKEFEHKLKETVREKDSIFSEKSSIINNLTHHLESAQNQCRELIETVEKLSSENKKLKKSNALDVSDSLRCLNEKTELMKSLQKELEKSQSVHNKHIVDFEKLQSSYSDLHKKYTHCNEEASRNKKELQAALKEKQDLQNKLDSQSEEVAKLRQQYDKSRFIEMEKLELERKISDLQNIIASMETKDTEEHAVQVSQFLNHSNASLAKEKEAREILEQELISAYETVNRLKQDLRESQEKLTRKLVLESEREKHIRDLQEKSLQFEKIIMERQRKPAVTSTGVNTEQSHDQVELLEMKFATELIEKEIQIRESVKKEFDEKLQELRRVYESNNKLEQGSSTSCSDCEILKSKLSQYEVLLTDQSNEVRNLKGQLSDDRNAVAELLDEWKEKFLYLEAENQQLTLRYNEAKGHFDKLILEMKKRDAEEAKRYTMIKKETEQAVKLWRRKTREEILNFALMQRDKVNEAQSRIEQISRETEREIEGIERQYLQNSRALEQWR